MASINLDTVYVFNGTLVSLNETLIVSAFTETPGETLVADGDSFDSGDTGATYGGDPATYVGGGTATVGVSLLGIQVNLSSSVEVFAFESDGNTNFYYPGGEPAELLDDLATQILNTPALGPTLALLGITGEGDLVDFLEQSALLTFDLDANTPFPICLTRGTMVLCPEGERPVEALRVGDLVMTMDRGPQPIRWIGSRSVVGLGKMAPVFIPAGALGNTRDMRVSQQHRMMISHWRSDLMFGTPEVLAPARSLAGAADIRLSPCNSVEYFHLFFDRHEIIFAEGCPTETFLPGPTALGTLSPAAREEFFAIFPDFDGQGLASYTAARQALRMQEGIAMRRYLAA
ncbi:Hint domain-containing protein [Rhodobacteraceae bacterium NNCM2]|nr:Hint domain-containing protein [Coraliihabitans acroporae]